MDSLGENVPMGGGMGHSLIGIRALLGWDQCHHLKAEVGFGGFQGCGLGFCGVDLEFLG